MDVLLEFLRQNPIDLLVALNAGQVFKNRRYNHQLEVGFRSRRHVVHVAFVDDLKVHRLQRNADFFFNGFLNRQIDNSLLVFIPVKHRGD